MPQIGRDRGRVDVQRNPANGTQGLKLGGESKEILLTREIERLDAEVIAREMQNARLAIECGERKKPVRAFQRPLNPEAGDGLDQDFRIRSAAETHGERRGNLRRVVEFTIVCDDDL